MKRYYHQYIIVQVLMGIEPIMENIQISITMADSEDLIRYASGKARAIVTSLLICSVLSAGFRPIVVSE